MSPLACPRCATPVAGPVTGSQLVCAACGHTWHIVPPRPPSEILRSDEYLPDEPGSGLQQARRALTERKEAPSPRLGELSETGLPELPALPNPAERNDGFPPVAPAASAPPLPPAPAAAARAPVESTPIGRDPSARRGIANDPAVGPTIDSRLFERLERDSQERRSKLATAPDLDPQAEPSGGVPVIDGARSCPVCGAAVSVAGKGKRRGCAQCGTVFDSITGAPLGRGASEQDPLIGRTLRGCLIDRRLGEGGMGTVYHARQLSLDRSVAVKVLPVDLGRNKNFIQRFEREAKSLARINHPNILQIYDFGEDPQLGIYFMVIEFVPGLDLGEVINRRGLLGQLEVLDMVRQALSGLEAAAEKGVIHRDIKPDNLMIGENGLVKVSDFGLAKGYVAQIGVTAAGVRVGTPAFMSPEQCDGTEVDSRSDIYNLGASAYLCLTGRLPFDGDSPFAIMLKHKAEPVPSMLTHDPGIDPRIDAIICRMMAKKPDDRCGSLRELIEEVEALETQLAGTDSVLRKSRGPFRALVASVRGGTETFPLVNDLELVDEPTLMEASAGSAGAPQLRQDPANITPPPLALPVARPGAVRPGSGLRPSREPSPGLDLARTDTDPGGVGIRSGNSSGNSGGSPSRWGLPAAITPEPAPKTGRITVGQRAIEAPPGSSASGSYATRGSASGGRPATASINRRTASVQAMPLPTPPPGLEPLASGRPVTGGTSRLGRSIRDSQSGLSSRRGEASLNEARDRGRRAEIEALANNAERLQAEGLLAEAAREFSAAADAAAGLPDEPAFRRRARSATRRDLLRTTIRRAVIAASLSLALVAAILLTVPKGHGLVADRRLAVVRENLVQVTPASQQAANLRAFARECEPLGWYVATFRRGYPLPARDAALAQADEIDAKIRLERQKVAVIPLDTKAIEAFGNDPQVPWADVQLQGEAFLAKVTIEHRQEPGVMRVADLTATAKAQQAAASLSVAAVAQIRATGDHRAALALADQVRRQFPRIPPVVAAMPQPGQVLIEVPGLGLPTDLTLTVDRVPVALTTAGSTSNGQLAQAVIARNPAGDTVIEATASGFNPARMALPANASSDKPARLGLRHATLWTLRALPAQTPWAQIEPVAGGLLVRHRDGLLRLRSTDGAVLATATRQTQQPGYARGALGVSGSRLLIPRENGTVLAFPPDLSAPGDLLHEGRGELTAWLDTEFTLRPGRKLRVVVEDLGPTQQVSALDGRTALWSYQALKGRLPAGLVRHDDRLIAIDDANLHVLEEDGRCAGVFALPGRRTGPVMPLGTLGSRSQVLVPTARGPVRLAFGGRQDPVRALADPVLASIGSATAGRLGDDLCLAGTTNLTLVQLGVRSVQVWQQPLTAASVFAPVLGAKLVVTVDPAGTLLLRDRASGAIQRSIVHGTPLLTPPLVLDTGSIIVLDRNGLVTAYK